MKRLMILGATMLFSLCYSTAFAQKIISDRFEIKSNLSGDVLHLSIDTNLPDSTQVIVSVSRLYEESGKPTKYVVDYFQEKGTVGKWRTTHQISLDNQRWKAKLEKRQRTAARAGIGFTVGKIEDQIEIRAVVPIFQADPRFGKRNANLTGKAVTSKKYGNLVGKEFLIFYPLKESVAKGERWGDWSNLKEGLSYRLSRETPLVPSHDPADPMLAIQQMKRIKAGGSISVRESANDKIGHLWYRVEAFDPRGLKIGTGWVNSTALIGQDLEVVRSK